MWLYNFQQQYNDVLDFVRVEVFGFPAFAFGSPKFHCHPAIFPVEILLVSINGADGSVKQTSGAINPASGNTLIVTGLVKTVLIHPLFVSTCNVTL